MNTYFKFLIFLTTILATSNFSHAKSKHISEILNLDAFINMNLDEKFKLSPRNIIAGLLCFMASSISSAGGIGGGGLFIPILTIVAGLELKIASSFSAFMVTGGSIANVVCNMFIKCPKNGGTTLIDYDIALLSEPSMLLGVSIGVICNVMLPEWLITGLFAVFLAWSTTKTCKSGVCYWNMESEEGVMRNNIVCQNVENGYGPGVGEPLLSKEVPKLTKCKSDIPLIKLGLLLVIWCSFLLVYLLRGNSSGQGIIFIKACGVAYWVISSVQIPLAIIFTTVILYSRKNNQTKSFKDQEMKSETTCEQNQKFMFPLMALLAGALGGMFGIGGGMLISPLLLQVGIPPEITSGTCSFMVFFSSTMSAIQYLLLGMEHPYPATIFAIICFAGSLIGLIVVQRVVEKHGRPSAIVFSVGTVMALSTVLITSSGAFDVWRDYTSGKYMGFKKPC